MADIQRVSSSHTQSVDPALVGGVVLFPTHHCHTGEGTDNHNITATATATAACSATGLTVVLMAIGAKLALHLLFRFQATTQ